MSPVDDQSLPLAERMADEVPEFVTPLSFDDGTESDLDRFRVLFDSVGVKYREHPVASDIGSDLVVDDLRAQARFHFNAEGKFLGYGVRE